MSSAKYMAKCETFVVLVVWWMALSSVPCSTMSVSDPDNYLFFEVKQFLFAVHRPSMTVWHVTRSEPQTNASANASESNATGLVWINLYLSDPFVLEPINQMVTAVSANSTRVVFVARLDAHCSALVLVDSEWHYQGWRIRINPDYFGRQSLPPSSLHSRHRRPIRPFRLAVLGRRADNRACSSSVPASGQLGQVLTREMARNRVSLGPAFDHQFGFESVHSVWSDDQHRSLYFVGDRKFVRLSLDAVGRTDSVSMQFGSVNDTGRTTGSVLHSMLYKHNYVLRVSTTDGVHVCLAQWPQPNSVQIGPKCTRMRLVTESGLGGRKRPLLGRMLDMTEYDDETTVKKNSKPILVFVVIVLVVVAVLIVVYLVAAKYCCKDSVAVIPFSGLNSKFVGKLRSISSIKTLNSDDDAPPTAAPLTHTSTAKNQHNKQPQQKARV